MAAQTLEHWQHDNSPSAAGDSSTWLAAARRELADVGEKLVRAGSLALQAPAGVLQAGRADFTDHPLRTIGECALSLGIGFALSKFTYGTRAALMLERAAGPSLALAGLNAIPTLADSGRAFADAWSSGKRLDADRAAVRQNLGGFLFDSALNMTTGAIAGRLGHAYFHPGRIWQGIPELRKDGYLPEGIHKATWTEFANRYGYNEHRRQLLNGMFDALTDLKAAGIRTVNVVGSFPRSKPLPGDFDLTFDLLEEDRDILWQKLPEIFDRDLMKKKYGGEFFQNDFTRNRQLRFFQYDDRAGKHTGSILLDLTELPPRAEPLHGSSTGSITLV